MFHHIVSICQELLQYHPDALPAKEYLNSRLTPESQAAFQFGYFPSVKNIHLLTDQISTEELIKLKLYYNKYIEDSLYPRTIPVSYFEDYSLIMPFKNTYGEMVGLVGRTLLSDQEYKAKGISKYKNTDLKKSKYLFGLFQNQQHILDKDLVYIVEGQFDVIKATERGINNIVAIGSSSLSFYQFSVITRYTNNIRLLLDNDEAGNKGRAYIMKNFGAHANICNSYLPDNYKDIDCYLSQNEGQDLPLIIKS